MLLQTSYPSLGFQIRGEHGETPATTVWELWDVWREDPSMASRNHIVTTPESDARPLRTGLACNTPSLAELRSSALGRRALASRRLADVWLPQPVVLQGPRRHPHRRRPPRLPPRADRATGPGGAQQGVSHARHSRPPRAPLTLHAPCNAFGDNRTWCRELEWRTNTICLLEGRSKTAHAS
jgi:hypothetical protein